MSEPILTIGIPTYNRSGYLKECLDHICNSLPEEVKVIVRDNRSSNYDFWKFIKPYQERYGVEAFQNDVNIGGDANIARLFELCKTKWLLVMGDDDYIRNGAIANILNYLKAYPDEVFIKFNSIFCGETEGIEGFSKAMKTKLQFGRTYFLSETVHNMQKTKGMMQYHYKYLSLFTAQILRDICYLLNTKEEKCLFLGDEILESQGEDIGWNRIDLVERSLVFMQLFRKQRNLFEDNIFKDITANSLNAVCESELSFSERMYYYNEIVHRYGRLKTIFNNSRTFMHVVLRECIGKKLTDMIKKKL